MVKKKNSAGLRRLMVAQCEHQNNNMGSGLKHILICLNLEFIIIFRKKIHWSPLEDLKCQLNILKTAE